MDRLKEILATMDVPASRREDWRWLGRNLGMRNAGHRDFNEACDLLKEILGPGGLVIRL